MGDRLFRKGLVVGIIVLLIAMSFGSSTGKINRVITRTTIFDGSLLGYVNDTSGNPIEEALVKVYFHGTYEEDYSDKDGYYHVTNIPICYCLKNATCSKMGYKTECVLLSITENTTHDFVLMPNHPPSAPTITGPINGKIGIAYTFQFNAVDPDNDDIKYEIKWGDGKEEVTDFYPSGEIVSVKHVWNKIGTYLIMARAQDEYGSCSDWGMPPIPITITKNKDKPINTLVQNLIQQYSKVGSQQSFSIPSSTTLGVTLSSHRQLESRKSENKEKLQLPVIVVHVREIYGTLDNPQYRPLANVKVKITVIPNWRAYWIGTTDKNGTTEEIKVEYGFLYKVVVSKKGYHAYKLPNYTLVGIEEIKRYDEYFTMAENGSPFVKQISQSSQQKNHMTLECNIV